MKDTQFRSRPKKVTKKKSSINKKDFERRFFSDLTNHQFVKTFMDNALRDPISGEIGKTIFCVSRKHATKMETILNDYAMKMFQKIPVGLCAADYLRYYGSTGLHEKFSNNNLNGFTDFLKGYKAIKTRVCITVGMMTTGYDCKDILNICMLKTIFFHPRILSRSGEGAPEHSPSLIPAEKMVRKTQNAKIKQALKAF